MMRKTLCALLALCMLPALTSAVRAAPAEGVAYLPGVTEEMTDPGFWTGGMEAPDALLATAEEIALLNAASPAGESD